MSLLGSLVSLKEQTHKTQMICIKEGANQTIIDMLQSTEDSLNIHINRINTRAEEREAYLNKGGWRG